MSDKTFWETFKAESATVADRVRDLVHQGNVRRVIVEHEGRKIAEFPLTVGVVGTMAVPVLAAIGALVAVVQDCTIRVEKEEPAPAPPDAPASTPPTPANP
jgi:hypothetical protein